MAKKKAAKPDEDQSKSASAEGHAATSSVEERIASAAVCAATDVKVARRPKHMTWLQWCRWHSWLLIVIIPLSVLPVAMSDFGAPHFWAMAGVFGCGKPCFSRALDLQPDIAYVWVNLGVAGGGLVNGTNYTEQESYVRALMLEPDTPRPWNNLALLGGGRVGDHDYDQVACIIKALELKPNFAAAWHNLGVLGGGEVNGTVYDSEECAQLAKDLGYRR